VKAGDITFTPDGCGHGLDNTGDTDLVFMALIILD
jgi:oxalate decarboxylase/phosphoglucose isomerase-like protein (cupin superfamily)